MAIVDVAHGTQTATVGTEHTLNAATASGVYVLLVDVNALAADETVELRMKCKVLTGGTIRTFAYVPVLGPANTDDMVYISVPVPSQFGVTATLRQVNGTGRAFDWTLITL